MKKLLLMLTIVGFATTNCMEPVVSLAPVSREESNDLINLKIVHNYRPSLKEKEYTAKWGEPRLTIYPAWDSMDKLEPGKSYTITFDLSKDESVTRYKSRISFHFRNKNEYCLLYYNGRELQLKRVCSFAEGEENIKKLFIATSIPCQRNESITLDCKTVENIFDDFNFRIEK